MRKNGKSSGKSRKTKSDAPVDIDRIMREGTEIDKAVRKATREAVLQHKRLGQSIVVWRRGKVVWLKPEEI